MSSEIICDVFDYDGSVLEPKKIMAESNEKKVIGKWMISYDDKRNHCIGMMNSGRNDFQNQSYNYIANVLTAEKTHASILHITQYNFVIASIYLAVRQCIVASWLNDRDQFFTPNDDWKKDWEFQSDCIAYTLLHGQNTISATHGTNHWIPFTESEVNAKQAFESTFMTDFMKGRLKKQDSGELELTKPENSIYDGTQKIVFSQEAKAVLEAGKELYKYYYSKPHITKEANNASFYDIRAAFQGIGTSGKMNPTSTDEKYNELIADLRAKQKLLAKKIQPKVYEYGFLK